MTKKLKTPTKKRQENLAVRERERLRLFNGALRRLQGIMPVRLPRGRRLYKKQTIEVGVKVIFFKNFAIENNFYNFLYFS